MDKYMMKQADKQFTWFYPLATENQLDFDGKDNPVEIILAGHIVYDGSLLCGEETDVVKKRVKASGAKMVAHRVVGAKTCKNCEEAYKNHPMSAYNVWVRSLNEAKAKKETTPALQVSG